MCHGTAAMWKQESLHLYVPWQPLVEDVHWQNGVACHDCHGGNPETFEPGELHAREDGYRKLEDVRRGCGDCHQEQAGGVLAGVHAEAGRSDRGGEAAALDCLTCHGEDQHHILPVHDSRSPVFLNHQVETCSRCHPGTTRTFRAGAHGHGLYKSGLVSAAVCADCHGGHTVLPADDPRSTLHRANVGGTCGRCHRFVAEEMARTVHGRGEPRADQSAPDEDATHSPTCTDCHPGHDVPHADRLGLRMALPHRCGKCHVDLSDRYALSVHGELTELGYGPAASCSDCHGAHTILPTSDAGSRVSSENRWKTCQGCHAGLRAGSSFLDYDPHADHRNAEEYPLLHAVYVGLLSLLIAVFGFFGLHSLFWFVRGLVHVLGHGRPRGLVPGTTAYRRFPFSQRIAHLVLLASFLGLAATGLPLKFSQHGWAKWLARELGGFETTGRWHRVFGVLLLAVFLASLAGMLRACLVRRRRGDSWRQVVFGPDSPVPNRRDLRDFGRMGLWLVGLRAKPTFERWSYWEKFDFWGAMADVVIIGLSGLVLWFPAPFCALLPGSAINIAKVIHSTQALLATGFVFAIHFFTAHLRAEKFPADLSMITGLVSQEEFAEERPEFLRRMAGEGGLERLRAVVPSAGSLWLSRLVAVIALVIGLGLLAAMIWAGLGTLRGI
ncbi:MAG: cytochrome b/b6 domain-containing protein [Pirellulales bacterium]|nr:cytochrome b/b6 domain-containing protein [Pirellulales bacterium]